jgi:hypothetical protein
MKGVGGILVGILALFLLIGPFQGPISEGIKGWRTTDSTETFAVTTAAGVTSANVTLGHDLYQAALSEVISVSSNITETPAATTYVEASKRLTVSALNANDTRTLTVRYYAETDDTVMRALGPFLSVLIFGGAAGAVLIGIWRGLNGRGR